MQGREVVVDNLGQLLDVLPPRIRGALESTSHLEELLEVVLDLGREPEARFARGFVYLRDEPVTREDIDYVVKRVGAFGTDNRAGIERTLHRISAIRNRQGEIIGLTCRVGRAVFGTINIVRDFVETGKSILLLGRPGIGKTTLLREAARVLADELGKRVVIVDTSNEIAGDGDIPHPGIGHARRMQVPRADRQAAVMIEAVENHMPEVIVIDEIGTEAEAQAARTIAERGVQLIGTAHGITLENLILNPTLSDLVGGIQVVTLGDEEAKKRGTQKTVLERKAPPTFEIVVEIQEKDRVAIHKSVADTVDRLLRGFEPQPEVRVRTREGYRVVAPGIAAEGAAAPNGPAHVSPGPFPQRDSGRFDGTVAAAALPGASPRTVRVYPYAVSRNRLEKAIDDTAAPVRVVDQYQDADLILTLKGQYRKLPKRLRQAEAAGTPVHLIRSNTVAQITQFLETLGSRSAEVEESDDPLKEVEEAVRRVQAAGSPLELRPQSAYVRSLQHRLIEEYRLRSKTVGEEPFRRVLILPEPLETPAGA